MTGRARRWLGRRWPECLLLLALCAAIAPAWRLLGLARLDMAALQALCSSGPAAQKTPLAP